MQRFFLQNNRKHIIIYQTPRFGKEMTFKDGKPASRIWGLARVSGAGPFTAETLKQKT